MSDCPHAHRRIDGVYGSAEAPIAVGWTCTDCGTSSATMWAEASEELQEEALEAERNRTRCDYR